jgi:hypothetical protein
VGVGRVDRELEGWRQGRDGICGMELNGDKTPVLLNSPTSGPGIRCGNDEDGEQTLAIQIMQVHDQ